MKTKKNIYFWILVIGPLLVVAASLVTIYIAHNTSPVVIVSDYEIKKIDSSDYKPIDDL